MSSVIAALALLSVSMLTMPRPGAPSIKGLASEASAYLTQRQGEWTAGVVALQTYLDQHYGEQTAGGPVYHAQQAYLDHRRGEWTGK
jgi:hypothetical protein